MFLSPGFGRALVLSLAVVTAAPAAQAVPFSVIADTQGQPGDAIPSPFLPYVSNNLGNQPADGRTLEIQFTFLGRQRLELGIGSYNINWSLNTSVSNNDIFGLANTLQLLDSDLNPIQSADPGTEFAERLGNSFDGFAAFTMTSRSIIGGVLLNIETPDDGPGETVFIGPSEDIEFIFFPDTPAPVIVEAVPLPGTGVFLVTAVAGIVGMRRLSLSRGS